MNVRLLLHVFQNYWMPFLYHLVKQYEKPIKDKDLAVRWSYPYASACFAICSSIAVVSDLGLSIDCHYSIIKGFGVWILGFALFY